MTPAQSLNLNVRGVSRSATLAINDLSNTLARQGRRIYRFGLGQSPFPVPAPIVEALRADAHRKDYLPVEGLPALRDAVAAYLRRRGLDHVRPSGVLVGPGSKELVFVAMLAYYGDVLVPSPCWVSYAPQARILGRQVRILPTTFEEGWRLGADRLEALCAEDPSRPRLLVLNYPGNPDGLTYGVDELERLAAVARKYGVILLSDEIYGELHHRAAHTSIARFYPEGTIVSGGLSKWCGAGGWRLGVFAFPEQLSWLRDAMAVIGSETYTSVSAPIQYAAVRAFEGGAEIERYLVHARRILAGLGGRTVDILRTAGVRVHPPEGGFYVYLDFSPVAERLVRLGARDGETLCRRLLEERGVALLPGAAFEQPPGTATARLAYVDFDGARTLAASEGVPLGEPLDDAFFGSHCEKVLAGVREIAAWLEGDG